MFLYFVAVNEACVHDGSSRPSKPAQSHHMPVWAGCTHSCRRAKAADYDPTVWLTELAT